MGIKVRVNLIISNYFILIQFILNYSLTCLILVLPSNSHFTNGAVTRTPAGIVASWVKPAELEHCDISYIVKFDSEFTEVEEQITAQSIIVPEDLFCLSIRVQVASVVGFSQMNFATVGYGYGKVC